MQLKVAGKTLIAAALLMSAQWAGAADLAGHGGPVRGIAVAADGTTAVTASFDSTLIRWSLARSVALQVMRFHEGAVNAVLLLADGRIASAGEDGRIALWRGGEARPGTVLAGHNGPISALAVSADGAWLASASWDGTARLWPLAGGNAIVLDGHKGNVNGVGFLPDGRVATAGYDGALRLFGRDGAVLRAIDLGVPLSALAVAPYGEIILAGADGRLRFAGPDGTARADIAVSETPLSSIALSRDGRRIAAAGFRGTLAIIERASRRTERALEGPAFPVWSLAFSADGAELLTGGANRIVRRWSVATGEPMSPIEATAGDDIPERLRSHPGAEVFRACVACHTLGNDGGNRAGPSLAGLYGRKIATAPGYDFSPALKKLDIIWNEQSVQRLFEIGPALFTPGTKMPEQKIVRAEDRAALADFLRAVQALPVTPP